jgi:hypothetical protein
MEFAEAQRVSKQGPERVVRSLMPDKASENRKAHSKNYEQKRAARYAG